MKLALIFSVFIATSALASDIGRYQFIANPQFRSEGVLLDTVTGKMWQRACVAESKAKDGPCQYSAWMVQDIEGISTPRKEILKVMKEAMAN